MLSLTLQRRRVIIHCDGSCQFFKEYRSVICQWGGFQQTVKEAGESERAKEAANIHLAIR